MDGEFLTFASAINPFVTDGDIIKAIVVITHATQAVQGITLYVVGPVIFGIDATISKLICSILNSILFFLGSSHLGV